MVARVDRLFADRPGAPRVDDSQRYAADFIRAVDRSVDVARGVVVAFGATESPKQVSNADALMPALERIAAKSPRLRLVSVSDEPLLLDPSERLDGWNYGGDAI